MREPQECRFTSNHQWVFAEGREIVTGLTDFVTHRISDVIHIELPEADAERHQANEDLGLIESLKMAWDIRVPVAGRVTAVNSALLSNPELINQDPYGEGWLIRMKPERMRDVRQLLTLLEYEKNIPDEEYED